MKNNHLLPFLILVALLLFLKPPEKADISDIKSALKQLSEAQKSGNANSEITLSRWLEKATSQLTARLLDRNPCEATWKDIQEALELMETTQELGYNRLSHNLMDWIRAAFRSYAHQRFDAGASKKEKLELASKAQALDLSDVSEALLNGRDFSSGCEEVWKGKFLWHQRETPSGSTLDFIDESEFHFSFYFIVSKEGQIKGTGRGELKKYNESIICKNGQLKEVPVEIIDRVFPVEVRGKKIGKEMKFNLIFSARIKRGPAELKCSETEAGVVDEEIIDIGKGIRGAFPLIGGYLFEIKAEGKHYTEKDPESASFIEITRIK